MQTPDYGKVRLWAANSRKLNFECDVVWLGSSAKSGPVCKKSDRNYAQAKRLGVIPGILLLRAADNKKVAVPIGP